jgi:hypothetical protein
MSLTNKKEQKRKKRQAQNETSFDEYHEYPDYFNFYGTGELAEDGGDDKQKDGKINELPREIYCDLAQTLQEQCAEHNILELWSYDESVIQNLTRRDIINDINTVKKSPVTGYVTDFLSLLAGKTYNSTGSVVGATHVLIIWVTEWDPDLLEDTNTIVGVDFNVADPFTMQWELDIINSLLSQSKKMQDEADGFELYIFFSRRLEQMLTQLVDGQT